MSNLDSIVADPAFDPEQFLRHAAILFSTERIVEFLLINYPELMLVKYNDRPVILDIIQSKKESNHRELGVATITINSPAMIANALSDTQSELADKLFDVFAENSSAQFYPTKHMSVAHATELIATKSKLAHWTELGYGLQVYNRLSAFKDDTLEALLALVAQENVSPWENSSKKSVTIIKIAATLPINNNQVISLLKSELPINNIDLKGPTVGACIERLSADKQLELLIHSYQDDHPLSEINILCIRRSIKIKEGIRCPLCTKRLKSLSGVTLHFELMHNIKNRWRKEP